MKEEIKKNFIELNKKFNEIKNKEYIKGIYNNLSAIGRTFEQELGLERNKESVPDYENIEIKTKRPYTKSYINLFCAVPTGEEENELKRIKDTYGYPCKKDKKYKVIYAEIYGDKINSAGMKYKYKLEVNKENQKLYLCVYNKYNELIEKKSYWTFEYLEQRLMTKLKYLAVINAWPKEIEGWNYFKYYKINYYVLKKFERFLDLIENGKIKLTLKVGIYLDPENYGKMYDHGCAFGISEENLKELFYEYDIITDELR